MSSPEGNYLKIKSSKEIFDEIASRLIDRASGRTTYEKVVPVPEEILALEKWQIDNWIDGKYGCPPGWEANVNEEKGEIVFLTDWRCAQGIIEYLAGMYPQARIEFGYTVIDDEVGIFECSDTYENGVLVDRIEECVCDFSEDEHEDEDE